MINNDKLDIRRQRDGNEKRAFISYSSLDKEYMEFVRSFAIGIDDNIHVFVDRYSIKVGDDWEKEIFRSLEMCDTFLVIWSRNARQSEWVHKESAFAIQMRKKYGLPKVISIAIDSERFAFGLEKFQAIRLSKPVSGPRFAWVILTGLLGTACMYGAFYFDQQEVLAVLWLAWLWITIFLFEGLREYGSPWKKHTVYRRVSILFHILEIHHSEAVLVFTISSINIVLGVVLFLIL